MPNLGLNSLFPRYDEIMEGMGDDPIKAITAKINQSIQGGAVDPTTAAMMGMPGLAGLVSRGGGGINPEDVTRPWVGIKPINAPEGTTALNVPKSYTSPTEIALPEDSSELAKLLAALGGRMLR
jgi:hypothetical protein